MKKFSLLLVVLGSILLPSYSLMELYFSNFQRVLFTEHCFDHITQEHSSQLRIHFDRFHTALLQHTSFFDFHQLDQSQFFLTFSNLQSLNIEQILFHSITQCKKNIFFNFLLLNFFSFSKILDDYIDL